MGVFVIEIVLVEMSVTAKSGSMTAMLEDEKQETLEVEVLDEWKKKKLKILLVVMALFGSEEKQAKGPEASEPLSQSHDVEVLSSWCCLNYYDLVLDSKMSSRGSEAYQSTQQSCCC